MATCTRLGSALAWGVVLVGCVSSVPESPDPTAGAGGAAAPPMAGRGGSGPILGPAGQGGAPATGGSSGAAGASDGRSADGVAEGARDAGVGADSTRTGEADAGVAGPSDTASPMFPLGFPVREPPPIFDQTKLHKLDITMSANDWIALRNGVLDAIPKYYKADIAIDGEVVTGIGIKSRGWGSRDKNKPGLKLDFNQYDPLKEYRGYKDMVLDNMTQDQTLMKERLAFLVFEAMGIPAPQSAFVRMSVNGQYWGLYALVESVSKPFLKARLRNESGTLYDFDCRVSGNCYNFEWRGDDIARYIPLPFEPKTNEVMPNGRDLVALIKSANMAPDSMFLADMSGRLEIEHFLNYVAVENAIVDHDGWVGNWFMNNFYVYQHGVTKRFIIIPWDKDYTFHRGEHPAYYHMDLNVLTKRLLAQPALKALYAGALRKAVTQFVNERWLTPKLDAFHALIKQSVHEDVRKPYKNADFDAAVTNIKSVIGKRQADVIKQIGM